MSQSQSGANLRKQFRIGSCNFSLESCRWRSINFRQKVPQNEFLSQKLLSVRIPNIRLHQTSVVLSDHIYIFGGLVQADHDQNFCAINLRNNKWHQLKLESNPSVRDLHGITILQHQIYLFGGSNKQKYFNDFYSFNNFTNEWKSVQSKNGLAPSPRDQMIFLSVKNQYLLLIGGTNFQSETQYLEDCFMWKNGQWKQLKSNYPKNLILAKAVEINGRVFLFGGFNRVTDEYSSTLYELFIQEQQNTISFKEVPLRIDIYPDSRVNHQLLPINNQYFLLIGGQKLNKKIFRDIWVFDLFLRQWTRIQPVNGPLKQVHSFSAVLYNNIVYIIGGFLQNRKQVNDQVFMIEFANQQIFKSEICENCVNVIQKKQQQNKKFPKDVLISVGFLYNIALEIKFPFHAISMIYEAAKYFRASYFKIATQKTLNSFDFLKIQFDGCSLGREEFISFISHNFTSSSFKKVTENIKLGAFRLGKTLLFVTSDKRYRYVYLLSAESRVSPHFDEAYIYYSYIQNMELQRIETEEGIKQRQLILNILRTHLACPEIMLSGEEKTVMLIFEMKVVMSSQKDYICELEGHEGDIKVWKNQKKVQFLEERGYKIQEELQISLRKWMMLYHLDSSIPNAPSFYINQSEQQVPFLSYSKNILQKLQQKGVVFKVELPTDNEVQISGQIYITAHQYFLQHNYGLLIYSQGKLYARYGIDFGRLFPQHFYKSKYKRAKTIFYELGYINIEKGLEQNFFKNGFTRAQKYSMLLEKIKQRCDEKREQVLAKDVSMDREQNEQEQSKGAKKVKV